MDDADDKYFDTLSQVEMDVMKQALAYRKGKKLIFSKINPLRLKLVWASYSRTGIVYNTRIIDDLLETMLWNTCLLRILTACMGHAQFCGIEGMESSYELNARQVKKLKRVFLETWGFCDFTNGQPMVTDYGLKPLEKFLMNALREDDYGRKLCWLDAMLNVYHQRSDLTEMFVEGGSTALSELSGTLQNEVRILNH